MECNPKAKHPWFPHCKLIMNIVLFYQTCPMFCVILFFWNIAMFHGQALWHFSQNQGFCGVCLRSELQGPRIVNVFPMFFFGARCALINKILWKVSTKHKFCAKI
jgi:hypothetical protein